MKMDPDLILEVANQITKLKMYPYFDIAHCILTCVSVKEDLGSVVFSRKHPLACWISSMIAIFAGNLLVNFFLGEPLITAFKDNNQMMLATVVWYCIFYFPFDITYKISKFLPANIVLVSMKETYRCRKICDGVLKAMKFYPNNYLAMLLIGTVYGNGVNFMRQVERLVRGVWMPQSSEVLVPSFTTKASIIAAFIFILDKKTTLISAPHALVYFGITIFFIYFKLSSLLLGIHDPFIPFENLLCMIFMGGIWDVIAQMWSKTIAVESRTDTGISGKPQDLKKKD